MDLEKIIETIDEPNGWLKISPSDIKQLNEHCKQLIIENEQLRLHGVVFNEAKTIDKQTQKKLIEQIMKVDEELGLYSEVELCECGGNKRVGLDCTKKPCKHPYYKNK